MKNLIFLFAYVFLAQIIFVNVAHADEMTFQASADATAVGGAPTNNYGDWAYARLRHQDAADWGEEYPLFKFDLSALPPVVWVNYVRMRFYVGLGDDAGLHSWDPPTNFCPVAVFNNLQDWNEMTVTYSNRPACESTPVQELEHFGLLGVDDVFFTYDDLISDGGWLDYYDGSEGTGVRDLVQAWADGSNNYGITIKGTTYYVTNSSRYFWLHTKEHPSPEVHPALIVDYTEIPEPVLSVILLMFTFLCFRKTKNI